MAPINQPCRKTQSRVNEAEIYRIRNNLDRTGARRLRGRSSIWFIVLPLAKVVVQSGKAASQRELLNGEQFNSWSEILANVADQKTSWANNIITEKINFSALVSKFWNLTLILMTNSIPQTSDLFVWLLDAGTEVGWLDGKPDFCRMSICSNHLYFTVLTDVANINSCNINDWSSWRLIDESFVVKPHWFFLFIRMKIV